MMMKGRRNCNDSSLALLVVDSSLSLSLPVCLSGSLSVSAPLQGEVVIYAPILGGRQ